MSVFGSLAMLPAGANTSIHDTNGAVRSRAAGDAKMSSNQGGTGKESKDSGSSPHSNAVAHDIPTTCPNDIIGFPQNATIIGSNLSICGPPNATITTSGLDTHVYHMAIEQAEGWPNGYLYNYFDPADVTPANNFFNGNFPDINFAGGIGQFATLNPGANGVGLRGNMSFGCNLTASDLAPLNQGPGWQDAFANYIPGSVAGSPGPNPSKPDCIESDVKNTGTQYFAGACTDNQQGFPGTCAPGEGVPQYPFEVTMTGNIYVSRPGQTYWQWQADDVGITGLGIGADSLSSGAQPTPVPPPGLVGPAPANCNVDTSLPPGLGLHTYAKGYNLLGWSGLDNSANPPGSSGDPGSAPCVLVNFPLAGTYPFELDYEENVSPPYIMNLPIVPPGSLTITKVINDAPVAPFGTDTFTVQGPLGATNQISAANGPDTYTFTISCATTGQPGTCTSSAYTLNNLVPGAYTITESSAAPGYAAAPGGTIPFQIVSGGTTSFTLGNNVVPASLKILKLDTKTHTPLHGASFNFSGPSFPAGGVTLTTGTDGTVVCPAGGFPPSPEGPVYQPTCIGGVISGLFPGIYTVTETGAPPDQGGSAYTIDTPDQTITLNAGQTGTLTFSDTPRTACVGPSCPTTTTTQPTSSSTTS
ncbi:MAG TPA: prealbumin-like fold domain-containing protein, partial [Acidimicrobiales bacterium]|nr:prealbumin-like fold domain-containing protein [Acidimicrobiales bacterium]